MSADLQCTLYTAHILHFNFNLVNNAGFYNHFVSWTTWSSEQKLCILMAQFASIILAVPHYRPRRRTFGRTESAAAVQQSVAHIVNKSVNKQMTISLLSDVNVLHSPICTYLVRNRGVSTIAKRTHTHTHIQYTHCRVWKAGGRFFFVFVKLKINLGNCAH